MTTSADATVEHRITTLTLQSITARIRFLAAQLAELDPELTQLVRQHPAGPRLLAEPGVGPVVAAQMLISWSHPGRVRRCLRLPGWRRAAGSQQRPADKAPLNAAVTAPEPGTAHRRDHPNALPPRTRAYQARRTAQGKTPRHPALHQARHRQAPLPHHGVRARQSTT